MKSSPIIVLFNSPPPSRRGPSGILISLFLHACACALIYLGLHQVQKADSGFLIPRYAVRIMELHKIEPKVERSTPKTIVDPGLQASAQATSPGGSAETATAPRIPTNFVPQKQALQTLIQPDAPHDVLIPQTALPQVLVWSSPDITVRKIVQPSTQTAAEMNVRPSLAPPNEEVRVSDLKLSSTEFDTKAPMPVPSKTSPINVQSTATTQQIPQTASKDSGRATPASVISASNIQLQEGTATLPMVNEVAPAVYSGGLSAGQLNSQSQTGHGKTDGKESGTAIAGRTPGSQAGQTAGSAGPGGQGVHVAGNGQGANGQGGLDDSVTAGNSQRTVVHITLPKDGRFGVVVVGSSLAEDYPETVHLWTGRLAYTVYLHVGATKNWVLQYSVSRQQEGATTSTVSRPEAPWPYDITRPSIDEDANTDAIMVHGFVNTLGRFEQLAVVFPTELAEAKFLLRALQQWQFRPATQNGSATSVEVLLIIPNQTE